MRSVTISSKGQLAIPKEIRERLHVKEGDQFDVEVSEGNIVLKPVVTITVPKNQAWFWSDEVQAKIREGEEEFSKGHYKVYKNPDDLINDLPG